MLSPVNGVNVRAFSRLKQLLPAGLLARLPAKRGYYWLGLFLLMAFMIQQTAGWRWTVLTALQTDKTYKLVTGVGMLAFILYQWRFSVQRVQGEQRKAAVMLGRHRQAGALLPLVFLGHSQYLGYGYVGLLSLTVLLAFLTGLFNFQIVIIHRPWYRPLWLITHVGVSMALLLLIGYHVYIDYAFK